MRKALIILAALILAGSIRAQDTLIRGSVTYISGDAIYTSLGRNAGIKDSSMLIVVSKKDSVAALKVFATSSKSSVCYLVSSRKMPTIGDSVVATIPNVIIDTGARKIARDSRNTVHRHEEPEQAGILKVSESVRSLAKVQGRISLQYNRSSYPSLGTTYSQPAISLSLRGKATDLPLTFDVYGTFRSLIAGKQLFYASGQTNQSRIYRLSLDYDDTLNHVAFGRILPPASPSIGYTDGLMYARRVKDVTIGTALGYEPAFTQRTFSTDMKKISFFSRFDDEELWKSSFSVSYARIYFQSDLDREVVSTTLSIFPSYDFFFTAMSDIDLRTKFGTELRSKAQMTSLLSTINYRISPMLSIGGGINAWRPVYSFAAVRDVPDSLLDQQLQANPNMSINLLLPGGISLYNTYTPRTSDDGFGHEYGNYSSIAISNLLEYGINLRGSMNRSTTKWSSNNGYGANVGKSLQGFGEVNLRYETYNYEIHQVAENQQSESMSLELIMSFVPNVLMWGNVERLTGLGADGFQYTGEVSWRF